MKIVLEQRYLEMIAPLKSGRSDFAFRVQSKNYDTKKEENEK